MKTDAQSIWKELEQGRHYKSGEDLYNIIATNERFLVGDHWRGVNSQNLPKTVYNFVAQIAKTQVSTVMSNQISIYRSPDALSKENEMVNKASRIFTHVDSLNWERCKMDAMNEDILMDAFTTGLGGTYWWWDEDLMTGNDFLMKGDFRGKIIDSVNLYVANPAELDIQCQEWVMIVNRLPVSKLKRMAKKYGVSAEEIEQINSDESMIYEAYDKAQNEQTSEKDESKYATYITKFYKEKGKVWSVGSTANCIIRKPYDTELTLYPIAYMNWDKRKRFAYGSTPMTSMIANQKVANTQAAMRHLHAQLMAIPKLAVNKNLVSGLTNAIGGFISVDLPPGENVGSAISFIQPAPITYDVDKSLDDSINRTKDLSGVNSNVTGESNPDNFRALVAQQKAAGVPLESVKRRFYQYVEDVALIWLDFYQHKYKLVRQIETEIKQGTQTSVQTEQYTGTDFEKVYLNTKIDVGASTQWSEVMQMDLMVNLWNMKVIQDPVDFIERIPDNMIPMRQQLIDKFKEMQQQMQAQQAAQEQQFEQMAQFLESLPPEVQAEIMKLPEGQQEQAIMQMMQQTVN